MRCQLADNNKLVRLLCVSLLWVCVCVCSGCLGAFRGLLWKLNWYLSDTDKFQAATTMLTTNFLAAFLLKILWAQRLLSCFMKRSKSFPSQESQPALNWGCIVVAAPSSMLHNLMRCLAENCVHCCVCVGVHCCVCVGVSVCVGYCGCLGQLMLVA